MTVFNLAVLGNPVAHSRSPEIHAQFAAQCGLEVRYERILVPEGRFTETATAFLDRGTGFNVTLPCKVDAWRFVEVTGPEAALAEAVNTVSLDQAGRVRGDNTDGPGMMRDITVNHGWPVADKRVLVLGAGGAVRGVLPSLLAASPALVHLHNRTHETAVGLAESVDSPRLSAVGLPELEEAYDLIINGTSTGLSGGELALPDRIISGSSRCYDMIYGSGQTVFNRWCLARAACQVADGLGMLVEQAALSFEIWFGIAVASAPVIRTLRETAD